MSEETPKRGYRKFTQTEREFMVKRFEAQAMPATVLAEMRGLGSEAKYNAVFYHWRRWRAANPPKSQVA